MPGPATTTAAPAGSPTISLTCAALRSANSPPARPSRITVGAVPPAAARASFAARRAVRRLRLFSNTSSPESWQGGTAAAARAHSPRFAAAAGAGCARGSSGSRPPGGALGQQSHRRIFYSCRSFPSPSQQCRRLAATREPWCWWQRAAAGSVDASCNPALESASVMFSSPPSCNPMGQRRSSPYNGVFTAPF